MEYIVVYNHGSVGLGKINSSNKKRKRFEKSAQQFDGILMVHDHQTEIETQNVRMSCNNNSNVQTTSMTSPPNQPIVTLYKVHEEQHNNNESDDSDASIRNKSENSVVGKVSQHLQLQGTKSDDDSDSNDVEIDSDDDSGCKRKSKGSWKKRQISMLRNKPKKNTVSQKEYNNKKHCKIYGNNKTTINTDNKFKCTNARLTVVYNGRISKYCPINEEVNEKTSSVKYFEVDDIIILGQIQVQIVSQHTSMTTSTLLSPQEDNNVENKPPFANQESSKNKMRCQTKAAAPAIIQRQVVAVPLQSRIHCGSNDIKQHRQSQIVVHQVSSNTNDYNNKNLSSLLSLNKKPSMSNAVHKQSLSASSTNLQSTSIVNVKCRPLKSKSNANLTHGNSTAKPTNSENHCTVDGNSTSKPFSREKNYENIVTKVTANDIHVSLLQNIAHIPLPGSIRNQLRPHQIVGVDFLWQTLRNKKGCILGDEMGLGKTLMTIACIVAIHRTHREKHFVVVSPSSLVVNWANEFDKWLGPASQPKRVAIREGGAEGLQHIRAYMHKTNQQIQHQPGQVLIISYDLLRRHVNMFAFKESISIGILVLDEAHRLKNANDSQTFTALQSLPTDARLCITATPIQNNLSEFFNLSNFCCPGIFGPNVYDFRKNFERPITMANQKNATRRELMLGSLKSQELEKIASTFMIRRLQKDVLQTMLPPRTEFLLFCRPTNKQCQFYRSVCKNTTLGNVSDALTTLITLRKICGHPVLCQRLEERQANNILLDAHVSSSGKMIVLDTLLAQIRHDAPGDKVVIVSNFTSVLSLVESLILQIRSYNYLRLDGTTKDRQSVVDTFNRTSVDRFYCLLLSSKAGGCGLNIVGANRLIMFDADWNPATCHQAMGRIYRQGQKKQCVIYRLFTSGTVEEVVYQRQLQKGRLVTCTVDAKSSNQKSHINYSNDSTLKFTKEELADCFNLKEGVACDTKIKLGTDWPDYDQSNLTFVQSNDSSLFAVAIKIPEILSFVHLTGGKASNLYCELEQIGRTENHSNQSEPTTYESDCEENEFF